MKNSAIQHLEHSAAVRWVLAAFCGGFMSELGGHPLTLSKNCKSFGTLSNNNNASPGNFYSGYY